MNTQNKLSLVKHATAVIGVPSNVSLSIPLGLSLQGQQAAAIITQFLVEQRLVSDDTGIRILYSPKEWKERSELFGKNSELVIVHDGGAHAPAFNWDYGQMKLIEMLSQRLSAVKVYVEQCTGWYSAVYHI